MKNFFNLKSLKENQILIFPLVVSYFLSVAIINHNGLNVAFFSPEALFISIIIYILSSVLDSEKYFNIGSLIAVILFLYFFSWIGMQILYKTIAH